MNKAFEAKNLIKKFGDFTAVNGVSFDVAAGEILGVLGRNGAGKTTTLQMCLGALTPTSGEIKYFGKTFDDKSRSEILEFVNFSSTYTFLPYDLTTRENLLYSAWLYKIDDRNKRLSDVKEMFELDDLWDQKFTDLSAGQKTRVNLAKAFVNKPKVLLLDEPTASLDPTTADFVRKLVLKEKAERNISVIFTSHNMAEVEEVCDKVAVIDHGRVIKVGTPKELASGLDRCVIKLFITSEINQFTDVIKSLKLETKKEGNFYTIVTKESKVSDVFSALAKAHVTYKEVIVESADLEDYFLETFGSSKEN